MQSLSQHKDLKCAFCNTLVIHMLCVEKLAKHNNRVNPLFKDIDVISIFDVMRSRGKFRGVLIKTKTKCNALSSNMIHSTAVVPVSANQHG